MTAPYENKELEDILQYMRKGLDLMRKMSMTDGRFEEYLFRFYKMIEYFLDNVEPIERMRILLDKRSDTLPWPAKYTFPLKNSDKK